MCTNKNVCVWFTEIKQLKTYTGVFKTLTVSKEIKQSVFYINYRPTTKEAFTCLFGARDLGFNSKLDPFNYMENVMNT